MKNKNIQMCYGATAVDTNNNLDIDILIYAESEDDAYLRYCECVERTPVLRTKDNPCICPGGDPAFFIENGIAGETFLKELEKYNSAPVIW